ncbi:MAG: glycosyltransferase family 52 [Humibacter sp.]
MRELTVSVIMPTHNPHRDRLLHALRSVLASTHEAIEVIVVDDGSEESVADWLPEAEPDPRVTILRQDNAGQGMARNAGIAAATGEFVFFIDDDDRVRPEAIALLVAHAELFDANVVVGGRYLVDEHGQVLSMSLEYMPGSTYRIYHGHFDYPFTDQMIHGRIIRRQFLLDSGIRFTTGHYEDRLFATLLYLAGPTHFANVPTYEWTQYTTRSTSSSTMSVERLQDKVRSLEACWDHMPHHQRPRFMREVLALDLTRFFQVWPVNGREYQTAFFDEVGTFLRDRSRYLVALGNGSLHERAKAVEKNDWDAMRRLYPGPFELTEDHTLREGQTAPVRGQMDDYFCHTHYHVLFSLLLAAQRKRPAQIFIYTAYQHFSARFLAALEATPWVSAVVTYTMGTIVSEIEERLDADPATAEIWLPHIMRRQFSPIIDAIDDDDQCFAFNDTLPSWYVIEGSFRTLTRVEDAYASLSRELEIHHTYGKWDRVLTRLGDLFPPTLFTSPKVTEIIAGAKPAQAPENLLGMLQVFDPLAAMHEHREKLLEFFASAYEGSSIRLTPSTVLIYTQPLAHIGHCSRFEQREMYRGMVAKYGAAVCVIKPHPADTVDYRPLGVPVMDRSMPSEVLNLIAETADIDLAVSFSSSAVNTTRFARRRVRLFGDDLTDPSEIRAAILSLIPHRRSLRFRLGDATWRYAHTIRTAAPVMKVGTAVRDPRALLGWPMWKFRRLLDVARRRLPV